MTLYRNHPDNPTTLEAAAELFQNALDLAKQRQATVTPAPWLPERSTHQAIVDTMNEATALLLDHHNGAR